MLSHGAYAVPDQSSQNALSHMWYSEISEYLINRGKTFAILHW